MWWERFDKFLGRMEKKGFNMANKLHIWTVNLLLCGIAYGTYTFFRDYNDFFLQARNPPDDEEFQSNIKRATGEQEPQKQ